ncbi:sensor histidine kinase [Amycolatopsis sp. H20-H5]|uniref:sensor histidine kinase n=1 Tax=Amycolatopsis sp. H20-H5 TaxID=3046309 RepID=UPI002DB7AF38|nr:HAMP domain-containing sensor histidine kinase [Amycolatopsis sp. H20-H5]MEC3979436.1 HAMP domain-containing sensor histidine kinase [Amycolatopsis sp. H20-H5]
MIGWRGAPPAAEDPETRALRHARRTITGEIAVVISLLVFLVGAIAYLVLITGQRADVNRNLDWTIRQGVTGTPPGCIWLFDGVRHAPASTPPSGMPLTESIQRVEADGETITERWQRNDTVYTVRTEKSGGGVVQVFFDERYQAADRELLLIGLAAAEVLALLGSVVTGHVLAGRAIRPLGEALRRQRTFVADASHELRAPLTRLHARAQLMSRWAKAQPERVSGDLDRLVSDTRELGEVIEDLLLSAQLQASPPVLEPVDLGELAAAAVAAESVRAGERGLRIQLRAPGPFIVRGVPTALRRVLSALLDNAIGHTLPGGTIVVELSAAGERQVELSVRDTGVGFDPVDTDRIFDRFARGDQGDGRRFGLGLALVREVVTGHGGTISALGAPDDGATFTLRFARAR